MSGTRIYRARACLSIVVWSWVQSTTSGRLGQDLILYTRHANHEDLVTLVMRQQPNGKRHVVSPFLFVIAVEPATAFVCIEKVMGF